MPAVGPVAALWRVTSTVRVVGDEDFAVTVSAGTLRPASTHGATVMAHRWTPGGVVVEADFTGAHLLHLAAAGCVLNDLYREAERLAITLDGARVSATGAFDPLDWSSTGISYRVEVAAPTAAAGEIDRLVRIVDDVAEIPRALRAGTTVRRRADAAPRRGPT